MKIDKDLWIAGRRTAEYRDSLIHQTRLWMAGISWHNTYSDECCPDFSCCVPSLLTGHDERQTVGARILFDLAEMETGKR